MFKLSDVVKLKNDNYTYIIVRIHYSTDKETYIYGITRLDGFNIGIEYDNNNSFYVTFNNIKIDTNYYRRMKLKKLLCD